MLDFKIWTDFDYRLTLDLLKFKTRLEYYRIRYEVSLCVDVRLITAELGLVNHKSLFVSAKFHNYYNFKILIESINIIKLLL